MATYSAETYIVAKGYAVPCWNGYFNVGGTKEDPIPNMIKLELTNIPINTLQG